MRRLLVALLLFASYGCSPSEAIDAADIPNWVRDGANPEIIPLGSYTNNHEFNIVRKGDTLYAFYPAGNPGPAEIALMTCPISEYPYGWVPHVSSPVLTVGEYPATVIIGGPVVGQMPDGSWQMHLHGYDGTTDRGTVATTSNANFPLGWTMHGSTTFDIGSPGAWDDGAIHNQSIVFPADSSDNLAHMYYGGYDQSYQGGGSPSIWLGGHATSPDGINWTRDPANPVLLAGAIGTWDERGVHPLCWYKEGTLLVLIYQGQDAAGVWRLGAATTPLSDMSAFIKHPNPIFSTGNPGAWDAGTVEGAHVYPDPATGKLDLWYLGATSTVATYRIGLARDIPPIASSISGATLHGATLY